MKFMSFLFVILSSQSFAAAPIAPQLKFGDPLPANAFVELGKLINPAVVNISTSYLPKGSMRGPQDPFNQMLEEFYGLRMQQPMMQKPMNALGTGFIIREDGLILTNNHVIDGADVVQVQLSEKSKKLYDAKVIGSDARTDIALLKITTSDKLPVAQLGSSKELEVGEWVAAFGNPFGQGHTMTKGIISATGRELSEINKYPLIQTDAPINPGNSGGPLVNLKGQVIGVNSAIDARAQGIGFAIPIDEVKALLPQLEKNGKIQMGYLGVGLDQISPQAAQYFGLNDMDGAIITSVDPRGPAAKAGVKPYDVVKEFNGREIKTVQTLQDAVGDAKIGSKSKMKIIREGKERLLTVTPIERPGTNRPVLKSLSKIDGHKDPLNIGFSVANISAEIKERFNIKKEVNNRPVIVAVESGSRAEEVGMLPGDVILEVNRKTVTNADQVKSLLKKGTNTLRISRGDGFAIIVM
jgi:serine protease Do